MHTRLHPVVQGLPVGTFRERWTTAGCASCHQARGQGSFDSGLPPLFHNTALGSANTNKLVAVTLDGIVRQAESAAVVMPGFGGDLPRRKSPRSRVIFFGRYGNPAALVTVEQVSALRAGAGSTSHLVRVARLLWIGVLVAIAALIFAFTRRRRARSRPA